ncbi:26S proteasome non-ATPase regulatory subunit 4, partial [Tanacetum coccineum]
FHPENCVGILAMGDTVYDLVKPTRDIQKIMSSIHGALIDNDSMSILDALERANQFLGNNIMYKRIVVFVGGIPGESKKGSLEALVTAANQNDNSYILHVPEDQLSSCRPLSRSPILSRTRWEQCCSSSFESIIARQKVQIDALTQENEKLKRELEFFRTESLKFGRKTRSAEMKGFESLQAVVYAKMILLDIHENATVYFYNMADEQQIDTETIVPKFEMLKITSLMTVDEMVRVAVEFVIPYDLNPRVPSSTMTIDELPDDAIGLYA